VVWVEMYTAFLSSERQDRFQVFLDRCARENGPLQRQSREKENTRG